MSPDAELITAAPTQYIAMVRKLIMDDAKGWSADIMRTAFTALSLRSSEDLSNSLMVLCSAL